MRYDQIPNLMVLRLLFPKDMVLTLNQYNREEVAHVPVQRDVGMIHPSRHNALFKKRFEAIKAFCFGTD